MAMTKRTYIFFEQMQPNDILFTLGTDHKGKATVHASWNNSDVAVVSPACVTHYPRVTGDGNFGSMWGPTDIQKTKFTVDLTDQEIGGAPNVDFANFKQFLDAVDERLLDFVQTNQLKLLGRKNLTRDEIKMLQIPSVKPKYDKLSGLLVGYSTQLSVQKFQPDGLGGKVARPIAVCDKDNAVVPNGTVNPGDVVAATCYINLVYTGVGGDKFGIHWAFEDVKVLCQRSHLAQKTEVAAFGVTQYEFAKPYTFDALGAQLVSDPMVAA